MGWVVYSDTVMRSSDAVLVFVVTASHYIGDAVSSHCREILEQCWCSNIPKQIDSLKIKDSSKPLLTSAGVKLTTSASGSKPSGNTKNNRITRPPSSNQKNKVEDHSRKVKSSLNKMNSIFEPISRTFTIVQNRCPLTRITSSKVVPTKETSTKSVATQTQGILVYSRRPKTTRYVGSNSKVKILESKTSNSREPKKSWGSAVFDVPSSLLDDFRFGNDHIAKIMVYGDYQMGNVTISRVYYVEGLGHNLFSVGQFCDSDLEFTWVKFLRSKDEVLEFVIKFLKMIQVCLNATVRNIRTDNGTEFVNHTLKAYYEEVRISHQTSMAHTLQQNGIVERRNRTLVEAARTMLIFLKAPLFLWAELKPKDDIGIFVGYALAKKAFLIYNKRTRMIIESIHADFDELTIMASEQFSSGLGPKLLTPGTIILIVIAPEPDVLTDTPSSTTIDQDAPFSSTSQTTPETPPPVIPLSVEEANHDIEVAHMDNNPSVEFPIPEPSSEESSAQVVIPNHVHSINQPPEHINKWTKDHPIDNVIGDPSRPVST
ncbi:retrovirus-related pol polyprotein from transposon TNT 1-94 [Tanacetum coccineum]